MRTIAILPVKRFADAKQRLSGALERELRASLAQAMFEDVLDGLRQSQRIEHTVVVTAGGPARSLAEDRGADVLEDGQSGHNQAAAAGIRWAIGAGVERILLVPGDCPALDPAEIDALLDRAIAFPSALIVPDRHRTGTNALVLRPPDALTPSFGPGSCERHRCRALALGLHCDVVTVPSLALDIDTPRDLDELIGATGRAPRTLALLSRC